MNDSNLRSKFTEAEIAIFKEGGVPKAYTWHHHQDEGVMQLVDRKIHRQTGHTGGFSIWGPENQEVNMKWNCENNVVTDDIINDVEANALNCLILVSAVFENLIQVFYGYLFL